VVWPPIEYDAGDIVRKVSGDGHISFKARYIRLGKPFRGEPIALRLTTEDGVFSILYCTAPSTCVQLRKGPVDMWTSQRRCPQIAGPATAKARQTVLKRAAKVSSMSPNSVLYVPRPKHPTRGRGAASR